MPRRLAITLLMILAATATAQECVDYGQSGGLGSVQGIDLQLDYGSSLSLWASAFVPHGDYFSLRFFEMDGAMRGVAFYSMDQTGELTHLTEVRGGSSQGSTWDFAVGPGERNLATYREWWSNDSGLNQRNRVIDLADPAFPQGELADFGPTWIRHGRALVETGGELRVYSLTNVASPDYLAAIAAPEGVHACHDVRGRLVVVTEAWNLEVWDVGGSGPFTRLAAVPLGFEARDVAVGDGFLLAVSSTHDLYRIDLGDPAAPVVPAEGQDLGLDLHSVTVHGVYAYVNSSNQVRALDLTEDPPVLLPGVISGHGWSTVRAGNNRIFLDILVGLYYAPVDCDDVVPTQPTSLGGMKALFR